MACYCGGPPLEALFCSTATPSEQSPLLKNRDPHLSARKGGQHAHAATIQSVPHCHESGLQRQWCCHYCLGPFGLEMPQPPKFSRMVRQVWAREVSGIAPSPYSAVGHITGHVVRHRMMRKMQLRGCGCSCSDQDDGTAVLSYSQRGNRRKLAATSVAALWVFPVAQLNTFMSGSAHRAHSQ